jgi:elongation factor Ts
MSVRRMGKVEGDVVGSYIHTPAADGMGKIGCLVALKGGDEGFAKQVAMHVAAADPRPQSLTEADLDEAVVEKEKKILTDQARESGKPENIIENMIKGRMKKFYSEVTLVNQSFVMNPDLTVAEAAKEAGAEVVGFIRFEVGEGIEKKEEDFAAEVAKTMGG